MVVTYVPTEQDESGTDAVPDVDELFELGVCGVADLAKPHITNADVQGVVISDATGHDGFFFLHSINRIVMGGIRNVLASWRTLNSSIQ